MPERRRVLIEHIDNGPDVSGQWVVRPGRRYGVWIRWREADVPEWARAGGYAEIERLPPRSRPPWRIVSPG